VVNAIGPGLCLVVGFGISSIESVGSLLDSYRYYPNLIPVLWQEKYVALKISALLLTIMLAQTGLNSLPPWPPHGPEQTPSLQPAPYNQTNFPLWRWKQHVTPARLHRVTTQSMWGELVWILAVKCCSKMIFKNLFFKSTHQSISAVYLFHLH
jgi:hypothetical protein